MLLSAYYGACYSLPLVCFVQYFIVAMALEAVFLQLRHMSFHTPVALILLPKQFRIFRIPRSSVQYRSFHKYDREKQFSGMKS